MSLRWQRSAIIFCLWLWLSVATAAGATAPGLTVAPALDRRPARDAAVLAPAAPAVDAATTLALGVDTTCAAQSAPQIYLPAIMRRSARATDAAAAAIQPARPAAGPDLGTPPALDRSVAYDIYDATRFIYTGAAPVQTGMDAGVIDRRCVAVLRGNVVDAAGQPLPGVTIAVKDHPEYGQTMSRSDGLYDLVINGGSPVVVVYQLTGRLPVQRRVDAPRRQYEVVPAVVLIPPDAQATPIDPNSPAPFQVARGSVVSDGSGARQATLLFPQGTVASLAAAYRGRAPLTTLTVRATEFTAGVAGAAAMPGDLPATSGYTYAVDFSFDEDLGPGPITFTEPVINYTENFIGAPVGSPVPAAYYDADQAAWLPGDNGIVVKIISLSGGAANLDVTGDGVVDGGAALTALGITDAERQRLAALYTAGQELWRVPLPHFSPWDFNWPFGPGPDAVPPPTPSDDNQQPNPCSESGSVIDCDTQALGESLPVTGTPFSLHYNSQRVPGWHVGNILDIPIVVGNVPPSLKSIYMQVEVGGQFLVRRWGRSGVGTSFGVPGLYTGTVEALAPNLTHRLIWNGEDGYGRATNGRPVAQVELRYVYDYAYYTARDDFQQSFGQFGANVFITSGREYCQYLNYPPAAAVASQFCGINMVVSYSRPLGYWDAAAAGGLGAWTLDVHHGYDPNDGVLHLGDGRDLHSSDIGPVMTGVIPDTSQINYLGDFALGPDGTLYFHDGFEKHIMRLEPDGSLALVAGNGSQGLPTGDGGPATAATLGWSVTALAVAPDGALYLAGTFDNYHVGFVRRVGADGIITTVAGTYFTGYDLPNGDGGPATAARLNRPEDILFGPDGSLYIAESYLYRQAGGPYHRIRKIDPNGIITTIAGAGGNTDVNADLAGVPALEWGALPAPGRLALSGDGSLIVPLPSRNTVIRIGPDGLLRRIAGNGGPGNFGDGGAALTASVGNPQSVVIDDNGIVYVRTRPQWYDRIRRITPEGIISAYAGRDCGGPQDNNGLPAQQACLSNFGSNNSLELAPGGGLLINSSRGQIERVATPRAASDVGGQTILLPDPSGELVYEFSSGGRHLRTLHALTGAAVYTFGYDAAGRLVSVTDADGNVTRIERGGGGQATAIVAPGGQRTTLTVSGDRLRAVTNPAGNTFSLAYNAGGLLTTMTDPRGGVHRYSYDADGRLVRDENAAGGVKSLARLEQPGRTTVTVTTGLGETTTYAFELLANGDRLRTVTAPDGAVRTLRISEGSVWTLTDPDGTVTRVTYAPDPRWGMSAPLAASVVMTTSLGLPYAATAEHTATLDQPANPFSLVSLQNVLTANGKTWRFTYTAATRTFVVQTGEGRTFRFVLDATGRVVSSSRDSSGAVADTTVSYDSRGWPTTVTQAGRTTQYVYNSANLLASATAPDGRAATFGYDAAGRLTTANLPGSRVISLGYDASDNLVSLTPPGRPAHTFSYTADDQLQGHTPPAVSGGGSSQWTYNADRNLTAIGRPGGGSVAIGYLYDGYRPGSVAMGRGTRSLTYDSAGRLATLSDPSGISLAFQYNGPLLAGRVQSGPVAGAVAFAHNADWLPASVTVNGANSVAYQYDDDFLLVGVGGLAISRQAQNGLVTGSQLGGVTDAWTYNAYAEATGYVARYNGAALYQATFTRDVNGRITSRVETSNGATHTDTYTYDAAGRLAEVRRDGSLIGSYTYDANGNRLNGAAVVDAQDRLLQAGSVQYTYSAAGELASRTVGGAVTTYQVDESGNLLAVTLPGGQQITYLVDGFDRRVGKRVNGTLVQGFLYEEAFRPIAELDGSNNVVSRFVYGARANVPEYLVKGGQTYRIISDHLGSPRLVVNVANGQVAQRLAYDAWGNVTQDTNPGFQPFGFAGGLWDRDTGLVRFGRRDYDPAAGRWTSNDPFGFAAGDTNLYAYVGNDPVNYLDPTGTQDQGTPSPCNPESPSLGERYGEFMSKWVGRPLRFIGDKTKAAGRWVRNKIDRAIDKKLDAAQETYEQATSRDPRDGAELIKKGIDEINERVPLPVTPSEAVKETVDRGVDAVTPSRGSNLNRAARAGWGADNGERN